MTRPVFETSEALHHRVRSFIQASAKSHQIAQDFDALACDIARYQISCGAPLGGIMRARGLDPARLSRASEIPAIPTDVFKLRRVACHEASHDEVVFRTSGTTIGARGEHAFRSTVTYKTAALAWAKTMLVPDVDRLAMLFLAPPPARAADSSLGFMLEAFAKTWGSLTTFALHDGCIDRGALEASVKDATSKGHPVLVAGASFAFVHLLDDTASGTLALPKGSRIMQTGGFKGRSREVSQTELRQAIAEYFEIPADYVVGEYGMTELSSQAYEGCLRRALGMPAPHADQDVYVAPPWMRVCAVDPETLAPVNDGTVGLARIEDLANLDSAVVIQTADRIRIEKAGFRVLGRDPGAIPRGCSIGIDEILGAS